jgi:hypothetical protein
MTNNIDVDSSSVKVQAEESFDEIARKLKASHPKNSLHAISLNELMDDNYDDIRTPIIEGLLYPGTYILAGSPKIGKSFLCEQIAYYVAHEDSIWEHKINKCGVLYCALEDTKPRLQERFVSMFGVDDVHNLFVTTSAEMVGCGLNEQLEQFINEQPQTKLIIIDTLQKIRNQMNSKSNYADDYEFVGQIKKFADAHSLCVILVHHTRKLRDTDPFAMISGTNGLMGCADGAFVLKKDDNSTNGAKLYITGRDQPEQCWDMVHDRTTGLWSLERIEVDGWKRAPDPIIAKVAALVSPDRPKWTGSASELVKLTDEDILPNALTRRLNAGAGILTNEHHIHYDNKHTRGGSYIELNWIPPAPPN